MSVFMCNSTLHAWQGVIDKVEKRISQWGLEWINPARKLTLMKLVLTGMPIYQVSTILAPKIIMNQMARGIRFFLCEEGKINNKKFHIINSKMLWDSKDRGGLTIRDIFLKNLAMVVKLVWSLVTNTQEWWKTFFKKYFS
jgi:hypothetical protein